jgi:methionyl-tRNA formyltransferase
MAACGGLPQTPQPEVGVTYAHKIEKAESAIDWRQPAAEIELRLRAFDPFPGGAAVLGGEAIKVWRAELAPGQGTAGVVLRLEAQGPVVACGAGALRLTELQRPGGKRAPAAQFLQGRPINPGEAFEMHTA